MNTFNLTLDLDKEQGLPQVVTLRQGDKSGTQLVATIYDHGQLVGGGYTARVSLRHPGSGKTYYRETAILSNGVATVTVNEQYAATVAGVTTGYFELLQGSSVKASTADFIVRILPSAEDGAVPGSVYDSAIEDALDELDAATGRISQMVVDATAEYLAAHPEITTTVQDNSVTDAKLIQSGGVLDRVGRLWWRLENLLTNTPAESESVTVGDAAKTPVAGLTVFGKSTQDGTPTPDAPVAIESVESANLCMTPNAVASGGLTFTPNADGSLDVNGTANGACTVYFSAGGDSGHENEMTLPAGSYALSGCPDGGSSNSWFLRATVTSKATGTVLGRHQNLGNGVIQFSIPEECWCSVFFRAVAGNAFSHQRLAPMLTRLSYAPFVTYDSVGLWTRGKNLLRITAPSKTETGVTYTVNEDKSVTVSGTATANTYFYPLTGGRPFYLAAGSYRVSGIPSGASAAGHSLVMRNASTGQWITFVNDANLASTGAYFDNLAIRVMSGTTVNVTYRIQIEQGTTTTAYEPYKESVTPIPLDGHVLRSLPDGTRDEATVDQYGHVKLVQRVTSITLDGATYRLFHNSGGYCSGRYSAMKVAPTDGSATWVQCDHFPRAVAAGKCYIANDTFVIRYGDGFNPTNQEELDAWFQANPTTFQFALATPQTIDLGTIDPTALVGPDMTAQAVPTAPFALTYERDLNATLARLEAALATLA